MQALTHSSSITESMAMQIIFDACRGNPDRKANQRVFGGLRYSVGFIDNADGTHTAKLRDSQQNEIASAVVDAADC